MAFLIKLPSVKRAFDAVTEDLAEAQLRAAMAAFVDLAGDLAFAIAPKDHLFAESLDA